MEKITIYKNYHKHDYQSNIILPDSPASPEDYAKRAVELGHTEIFTTQHGWGGDIFEYRNIADRYGLRCIFGIEGYIVPDVSDTKDKRNYHIFISPKTDEGRKKLNLISSNAHDKYFYYRPRFSLEEILKLDRNGFIITTACIAGIVRDEDGIYKIFEPLIDHFRENVFLEIQPHVAKEQAEFNRKIIDLHKIYGIKLISGMDSHYIFPEDSKLRDIIIEGKGVKYEEKEAEDKFILDYPDIETILTRYSQQGVVPRELVIESLKNTFVFDECETIGINKIPKMPNIYKDKTPDERYQILCDITWKRFEDVIIEDEIKEEDIPRYKKKLQDCLDVVKETEELNTQDYFLINEKIVDVAVSKYNGVITRTGRGSGGAFYLNRSLGLTQLDDFTTDIPIYPERFMSTARILENHSFPDIDLNVAEQEPFRKAAKDVLGEHSCYQMTAYGTMQLGEAFRNYCRSIKLPYAEYNEVAKNIEKYEDDPKWSEIIEKAKKFVDTIVSISVHPCFDGQEMVRIRNGYKKIKDISVGDMVLSSDGRYHSVLKKFVTFNQETIELRFFSRPNIITTKNHPFFVRHMAKRTYKGRVFEKPLWKKAKDLLYDDYVLLVNLNEDVEFKFNETLPICREEFWWYIGRWLGDGWRKKIYPKRNERVITVCCSKNELNEITEVLDKLNVYHYWIEESRTTYKIHIHNIELYEFLGNFGDGAKNKHIPDFVLNLNKNLLKSFIEGYISADGHKCKSGRILFTTVSEQLAYGISNCVMIVYNVPCSVKKRIGNESLLEGRLLKRNVNYVGSYSPDAKFTVSFKDEYGIWIRFKDYLNGVKRQVYNIEVEDTNNYLVKDILVHNCSCLIFDGDIREELGIIHTSKGIVVPLTSDEADDWKYLKEDFLGAIVWKLIADTFEELHRPIMSLRELKASTDDKTWEVYEKGLCCTVNQVDSNFGTSLAMRYKPRSIDEVAKLTAAIRPSFEPWRDNFIERRPYTNHNAQMDKLLEPTDHYILFQENIMQFFEWLDISPAKSIGLIKKISKKKIKDSDFKELEDGLRESWIKKCGSIDGFDENWAMIQSCMAYGFNCLTGSNNIWMLIGHKWKSINIHQLYLDKMKYISILASKDIDLINENQDFIIEYTSEKWIYSYDEKKHVVKNLFYDIEFAGEKNCIAIFFENGTWVECTPDHKFPTPNGMRKAGNFEIGDCVYISNMTGKRKWVKPLKISKIYNIGLNRTYFISVSGPLHTFVLSNGVVTSNSPHALAYGYDSTYGAYLKSHYPLQYFTVALNIYEDDLVRTSKLTQEMSYYRIYLEGVKFGKSRSKYNYDEKTRKIYKSVKSVKYLSAGGAEELYELRDNDYPTFIDLLYDIKKKTSLNARAIEVLIKIDFFSDFGIAKNLDFMFKQFVSYNNGETVQVKKDNIPDSTMWGLLDKYGRETDKMFVDIDMYSVLKEMEALCNETNTKDYSIIEKMRFQEEYMGFITFNTNNPKDRFKLAILGIRELKRKSDGKVWARELDAISIGTSRRNKITVYEDYFSKNQLMVGDIIMINPKNLQKKEWNGFTNWYIKYYDIVADEKVKV